jgi:hypothetical protein
MSPSPIVAVMRMTKFSLLVVLPVSLLTVAGCGKIAPLGDLGCPCESGWSCCDDTVCRFGPPSVCSDSGSGSGVQLACTGAIDLGTQTIVDDSDASVTADDDNVRGYVKGVLVSGEPISFNYSTSIWPSADPAGWAFQGWLVTATASQALSFQVLAEQDAGPAIPLPVVTYGPLAGVDAGDAGTCSGSPQSSAVMSPDGGGLAGNVVQWTPDVAGTYLVVPYHQVTETSNGLAFQGMGDNALSNAVIVMNPSE